MELARGDKVMRTVELLEQAIATAKEIGYGVRHEWLGGGGGGSCEFAGKKWLFVDLALNVDEQLEQVCQVLRSDSSIYVIKVSSALRRLLESQRAA